MMLITAVLIAIVMVVTNLYADICGIASHMRSSNGQHTAPFLAERYSGGSEVGGVSIVGCSVGESKWFD
jgi:hypothetical protein